MRILYLDLDTLRPDHLSCYGYHRNTSPNIDRMCREGIRFDNYYCSDAPCLPSRAALMSGRFGIHTGVVGHGGTAADPIPEGPDRSFISKLSRSSLPGFLKSQAGLYTAYIGGFGERHSAWSFYAGFREIYDTGKGGMESAEDVTPTALDWIERNAEKDNWYLQVNYWDPHTPYRAPEKFGNPFENNPLPEWLNQELIDAHRKMPGPHGAQEFNMYNNHANPRFPRSPGEIRDIKEMRQVIDGYDCGIAYMDEHIGRLFSALDAKGVMDDLIVIVSSDHGENFGELAIYGEHATADAITCHIPMIIRWPGMKAGHVDSGLHYNIDLIPSLADLLDKRAAPIWDGQSFAEAITKGEECGRDYLVISQCAHVCQRSVRWGPWLYMRTYHDGYHLFPDEMLFHLETDPHEQEDLAAQEPGVIDQGRKYLSEWFEEMMNSMHREGLVDPMQTVLNEGGPLHARGRLRSYAERLAKTGRADFIDELKRRHPDEFSE